jgi:Uma2 family endonuclease
MTYHQAIVEREPRRHRITVEEFLLLDERGAFGNEHAELLDGDIYIMSPIFSLHSRALSVLTYEVEAALRRLGGSLRAFTPTSTMLGPHSLVEPDLLVARTPVDPIIQADAVQIAFEVSASSLGYHLGRKATSYAAAGIPEYWLVDVASRRVIRLNEASSDGFANRSEFDFSEAVSSIAVPGLSIHLSQID